MLGFPLKVLIHIVLVEGKTVLVSALLHNFNFMGKIETFPNPHKDDLERRCLISFN